MCVCLWLWSCFPLLLSSSPTSTERIVCHHSTHIILSLCFSSFTIILSILFEQCAVCVCVCCRVCVCGLRQGLGGRDSDVSVFEWITSIYHPFPLGQTLSSIFFFSRVVALMKIDTMYPLCGPGAVEAKVSKGKRTKAVVFWGERFYDTLGIWWSLNWRSQVEQMCACSRTTLPMTFMRIVPCIKSAQF